MTNPAPLSVDPEQLGLAGGQLLTSAAQLPTAPAPFMPVGTDPLSVAIIGQIPMVDGPPMTELPLVQEQSTATARNVVGAAEAYASTDQQLGGQIDKEMQNLPGAPGSGAGGAGPMGQMNQMMSMPMQMAGQMAQMPMQVMGGVAALPQGVMQGAQQVGQQVGQMAGQFGQGGAGGPSGVGGQGDSAGRNSGIPGGEPPEAERAEERRPQEREGAAAGQPGSERAPAAEEQDGNTEGNPQAPGRHRLPDSTDGIDL
jgi:hypothetical protein